MSHRILLVDDEAAILLTLKAILEMNGFGVETASSAKEAKHCLKSAAYDLVITDLKMERDKSGFEVSRVASQQPYRPSVALLTAYPDLGADWKAEGVDCVFIKPTKPSELLVKIEDLLATCEMRNLKKVPTFAAEVQTPPVCRNELSDNDADCVREQEPTEYQ